MYDCGRVFYKPSFCFPSINDELMKPEKTMNIEPSFYTCLYIYIHDNLVFPVISFNSKNAVHNLQTGFDLFKSLSMLCRTNIK